MLREYAETKKRIKDNFVNTFAGFVGCDEVDVYCEPNFVEFRRLFHSDLTDFARSDDSKTKVIIFAYAGHGCSDNKGTHAILNTATKNIFPLEAQLATIGQRDDVHVLAALNCCRTK